jgi:hypothetical protein
MARLDYDDADSHHIHEIVHFFFDSSHEDHVNQRHLRAIRSERLYNRSEGLIILNPIQRPQCPSVAFTSAPMGTC